MMQWIDALSAQQKAGAIAGLDASRQSALSSLGSERTALTPAYATQRQQIAATGDVEAQRMNEFLAAQGLARSGAAGELQGRVGAQTTGQLAQARQSEQSALQDILRRQSDVEAQYQIGLQNANSAAEVSRIQNLIDQARADRNYELQAAGYTGMLGGQQTMQGAQNQRETQAAALQTQLDTLGQYSNDYAAEINARTASPDKADDALIPYLTTARNAKVAAQQAAQSESSQAQYKEAMDMFKTLGTASGWVAKALGLPEGATTREYLKTVYDVSRPYYKATSGATDKSIAGMGTESQVAEYYDTLNSYVTGTVGKNDPEAAYDAALAVKGDLVTIMGEKLATQLLSDLKSRATTVGQPKIEEPTVFDPAENIYAKRAVGWLSGTNQKEPDVIRSYILSNVPDDIEAAEILNYLGIE
jgi:hypothetical protein